MQRAGALVSGGHWLSDDELAGPRAPVQPLLTPEPFLDRR